jgi:hypothetical protein
MSINWHELTTPTIIKVDPLEEIIEQERQQGRAMIQGTSSAQDKGSSNE